MNYKMIGRFLSKILQIEAAFMIPALLISVFDKETKASVSFLITMGLCLLASLVLDLLSRKRRGTFQAKEGFVCTGLSWIILSLFGALPFWISGEVPKYIDAFFEIVSGFTTTGASILPEVEALSRGILYWRSFSHWLGGMGVLVFVLALIPNVEKGSGFSIHLLRAESPGPDVGKLVPRLRETAFILYIIYFGLTVLNVLFLWIGHIPLFDAVCTAFGCAGTGGFGIKNDSIASYSPYVQNVCTVFMLLFGVNFTCYYLLIFKRSKSVFKDEEIRMYFGIVLAAVALIAWNVRGMYATVGETLRHCFFQVASIITTTGFATTDFDLWPGFSKSILLCLMVVGACAGSTGGGFKCQRLLLVIKNIRRNIHKVLHPREVRIIRYNGGRVNEDVLTSVDAYLAVYFIITIVSFLLVSIDNMSTTTSFSAVLACFNNIGPGLDAVGPTCNYGMFSIFSKFILIFDMLAGRLEIYAMLVLLSRSTWRRK